MRLSLLCLLERAVAVNASACQCSSRWCEGGVQPRELALPIVQGEARFTDASTRILLSFQATLACPPVMLHRIPVLKLISYRNGGCEGAELRPHGAAVTVRFGVEEDDRRERGGGGGSRGG